MNDTTLPGILMGALAASCLLVFLIGLRTALKRSTLPAHKQTAYFSITALLVIAWVVLIGVLSATGFFSDLALLPPRPVLAMLSLLPVVLIVAFSKGFGRIALATPPHWLLYFQSFRILVEFLLWQAFLRGLMPSQMTFEGRNYDIAAGILALAAGFVAMKQYRGWRRAAILYNIIGLALLVNVLTIALLSMPTPLRQFMNEPPITIVGQFPFIYLPTVLVVFAYSFHILSLRQLYLLGRRREGQPVSGEVRLFNPEERKTYSNGSV